MARQITNYSKRAVKQKRYEKKTASKERRRLFKQHGETAPSRMTKGYLS